MMMSDVVALVETLGTRATPGPHGVEFSWYYEGLVGRHGSHRFRVESGSGIAGRGHAWNLVELPSGEPCGPKVTARRDLRRQLLETLAEGQRPEIGPDREAYARRHTYGLTSSIQWFTRRKKGSIR